MQKYIITLLVILLMIVEFFIVKEYYSHNDIDNKLDKLEQEISLIANKKDSIRIVIDTINKEIVHNNNYYEKDTNTIMSQPSDSDAAFIRYYICRFAESRGLNLQ